jgi:protein disulfide-isomerase-like protein
VRSACRAATLSAAPCVAPRCHAFRGAFRDVGCAGGCAGAPLTAALAPPQCGHCKSLAPEWKKAATQLKGTVRVGAVDCDSHKELASKYGVKGFPTIKTFGEDKTAPPVDYTGAREAAAIVAHGQAALGAPGGGGRMVTALTYLSTHTFLYRSGACPCDGYRSHGFAR